MIDGHSQGESAGAGSVLQHVIAHGGNTRPPLFRGAMMSSLFLPFQYDYNDTIPEVYDLFYSLLHVLQLAHCSRHYTLRLLLKLSMFHRIECP